VADSLRSRRRFRTLPRILLLAVMSVIGAAAQAQAVSSTSERSPADIVVTAQFRAQRLQDTPIAISAIDAEMLASRNQANLADAGLFTPNVNLSRATAINANSLSAFIRGVGQEDASFALEPGVGIYVDEIYYGTMFGAAFELSDLDRVEILRGPQGTLAGKNSLGGAIRLISKRPEGDGSGYVQGTFGRFDRAEVRGALDMPIAKDVYARLSGTAGRSGGFFKLIDYGCANPGEGISATRSGNCVLGKRGGSDRTAFRAAVRYLPTEADLEINLIADISRDKSQQLPTKTTFADVSAITPSLSLASYRSYDATNILGGVPFDGRFLTAPHTYSSYENDSGSGNYTTIFGTPFQVRPGSFPDSGANRATSYGFAGIINVQLLDNLSLKSITGWRNAFGLSVLEIDGSPITILKQKLDNSRSQMSQEFRLSGSIEKLMQFTIGAFYYRSKDNGRYRTLIPTFLYDFLAEDTSRNRSMALFSHTEIRLSDSTGVIIGLRYTRDRKRYDFIRRNADGTPISGIPLTENFLVASLDGIGRKYGESRVDYRVGVNFHASEALMLYAQLSTGYKGGGINPRPFVADQVQPFGLESLTTWESGFKANLFDRTLTVNGAAFHNEYRSIQRTIFVCPTSANPSCSMTLNAGDGHSNGMELEWQFNSANGLNLNMSAGYLDFSYDSINPLSLVTSQMAAPFSSKWALAGGMQYQLGLANEGVITPRVDWNYRTSFYYGAINNPYNLIGGRSIFDVRLTYRDRSDRWSLSAAVTNVMNKFHYVGTTENISNFGLATAVLGRPREWSATVRYNI